MILILLITLQSPLLLRPRPKVTQSLRPKITMTNCSGKKLTLVGIAMCCPGYYLSLQSQQKHCVVVNLVVTNISVLWRLIIWT